MKKWKQILWNSIHTQLSSGISDGCKKMDWSGRIRQKVWWGKLRKVISGNIIQDMRLRFPSRKLLWVIWKHIGNIRDGFRLLQSFWEPEWELENVSDFDGRTWISKSGSSVWTIHWYTDRMKTENPWSIISTPKTISGRRTIPMIDEVYEIFLDSRIV